MNEIISQPQALAPSEDRVSTMSLHNFLELAVRDKDIDVAKLDALLRMQWEIAADGARIEFARALAQVQASVPRVRKNGRVELGGGKGYDFAKWEDMDRVLRPVLEREGFSLSFDMAERQGGGAVVTATVEHVGGHKRTASIPLPLDSGAGRNNLQAMGSTLSYAKRYLAEMLFNIVREGQDDDGVTGGVEYIDAEQVKKISALLLDTQADLDGFLHFMGAPRVEGIRKQDFSKAMNALMAKKRAMAKPAAQGEPT